MTRRRFYYEPAPSAPPATITLGRVTSAFRDGTSGSYTVGWTSGGAAANGTWLLAIIEESTDSGTHPYISGGSTWTRIGTTKCYYKQCGPTEPSTYTISFNGSSKTEGSAVAIIEIFGASSVYATANASNTNASPPVSSYGTSDLIVCCYGNSSNVNPTVPSGWTKQIGVNQNASVIIATKLLGGVAGGGNVTPGVWGATGKKLYTVSFKA